MVPNMASLGALTTPYKKADSPKEGGIHSSRSPNYQGQVGGGGGTPLGPGTTWEKQGGGGGGGERQEVKQAAALSGRDRGYADVC